MTGPGAGAAAGVGGPDLAVLRPGVWDAIVVGAGPAGSMAARRLALRGLSVLLVDKAEFPRNKVCGCCLSGAALGVLERAGLGRLPYSRGARPLERLDLAAGTAHAVIPLGLGAAVSRSALDAALAREAVEAGVVFLPGTLATPDGPLDAGRVLLRRAGTAAAFTARAVVVADGLAGTFLAGEAEFRPSVSRGSRMGAGVVLDGAGDAVAPGVVSMTCGPGGYVGMVRLEGGGLDFAAALDHGFVRSAGGPGRAVCRVLAGAGRPAIAGLDTARWRGTPPLTRRRRVQAGRIFVIGDAAGYVEPFTGEGIAWALASALASADVVERWLAGREDAGAWERRHRALLAGRHRICLAVGWALRRPRLVGMVVRAMALAPPLVLPLVRAVDRPWAGRGARA